MFTNVKLAWAMPVDPTILCARIEAYVATKSSLTTLRCCIKHASPGTPLGQVPAEVSGMIADYVHHNAFLEHEKTWNQNTDCWHGLCRPSKHIDANEYQRLKYDYVKSFEVVGYHDYGFGETIGYYRTGEFVEEEFEKHLRSNNVGKVQHEKTIEKFDAAVKHEDSNRFTKALKIMTKDFGLEVHLGAYYGCVHPRQDDYRIHNRDVLAYLILPSKNVYATTDIDPFHSLMVVDSAVKKKLSEEEKLAFKRVKKMFGLSPCTLDVKMVYRLPRLELKPPTKKALRMAFLEKKVDVNGE